MLRDENRAYVFTLIQKYRERVTEAYRAPRRVVISDGGPPQPVRAVGAQHASGLPRPSSLGFTGARH